MIYALAHTICLVSLVLRDFANFHFLSQVMLVEWRFWSLVD